MEGFIGEEQYFIVNTGPNREPVMVHEGRGDVLPGLGSRVLNISQLVQGFAGQTKRQSVAVPQSFNNPSDILAICKQTLCTFIRYLHYKESSKNQGERIGY